MITTENARALAANMREIAELNREDVCHLPALNHWRRRKLARAAAYDLAARWVDEANEETKPKEAENDEKTH